MPNLWRTINTKPFWPMTLKIHPKLQCDGLDQPKYVLGWLGSNWEFVQRLHGRSSTKWDQMGLITKCTQFSDFYLRKYKNTYIIFFKLHILSWACLDNMWKMSTYEYCACFYEDYTITDNRRTKSEFCWKL